MNNCKGIKKDGEPCTRLGKTKYEGYCGQHNNQLNGGLSSFQKVRKTNTCKGLRKDGQPCERSGYTKYQGYCSHHNNQLTGSTDSCAAQNKATLAEAIKQIEELTISVNQLKFQNLQMHDLIQMII